MTPHRNIVEDNEKPLKIVEDNEKPLKLDAARVSGNLVDRPTFRSDDVH
jgi:hypothetical protein